MNAATIVTGIAVGACTALLRGAAVPQKVRHAALLKLAGESTVIINADIGHDGVQVRGFGALVAKNKFGFGERNRVVHADADQLAEDLAAERSKVAWVRDIARTAYRTSSRIDPYEIMRATLSDAEVAALSENPDRNPFRGGEVQ